MALPWAKSTIIQAKTPLPTPVNGEPPETAEQGWPTRQHCVSCCLESWGPRHHVVGNSNDPGISIARAYPGPFTSAPLGIESRLQWFSRLFCRAVGWAENHWPLEKIADAVRWVLPWGLDLLHTFPDESSLRGSVLGQEGLPGRSVCGHMNSLKARARLPYLANGTTVSSSS